jgi:hypothetical protein
MAGEKSANTAGVTGGGVYAAPYGAVFTNSGGIVSGTSRFRHGQSKGPEPSIRRLKIPMRLSCPGLIAEFPVFIYYNVGSMNYRGRRTKPVVDT